VASTAGDEFVTSGAVITSPQIQSAEAGSNEDDSAFTLNAIRGDCRCARISDCCRLRKHLAVFPRANAPSSGSPNCFFSPTVENVRSHSGGSNRAPLVCACGDVCLTLDSLLNKRFGCLPILNRASAHDRPPALVSRFHLRLMLRSFSMKRPYMTGAGVPSDHLRTATTNTSIGCAPLNCGFSITGDFGKSAPQTFPSRGGV